MAKLSRSRLQVALTLATVATEMLNRVRVLELLRDEVHGYMKTSLP